jgi:hypothetical protein
MTSWRFAEGYPVSCKFLEMMMLWKNKKNKPAAAAPQPEEGLGKIADMTLDEHMLAAENVMTCRDFLNLFMNIIRDHREDGHDCLPYCMPEQLYLSIEDLELDDIKMILTVALKDMYNVYLQVIQREDS